MVLVAAQRGPAAQTLLRQTLQVGPTAHKMSRTAYTGPEEPVR